MHSSSRRSSSSTYDVHIYLSYNSYSILGRDNYLCKVEVEEKALSCIRISTELDDREVSIVWGYHKVFWIMDVYSILKVVTQFKYQPIVPKIRSNLEGKVEGEVWPILNSRIIFPPQICWIHQRKPSCEAQENIVENVPLVVGSIFNASLTLIT